MEKKKKIILLAFMLLLLCTIIYILVSLIFPSAPKSEPVTIELPEAHNDQLQRAKIQIYEQDKKPVTSYDEYIAKVTSTNLAQKQPADTVCQDTQQGTTFTGYSAATAAQQALAKNIQDINNTHPNSNTTATAASTVKKEIPSSKKEKKDWQERFDYMYNKVYGTQDSQEQPQSHPSTDTVPMPIDDGFITVVGTTGSTKQNPVQVATTSSSQVCNGDKVQLRLLEDVVVNNIPLKRNTYIYAIANVSDNRLQLAVSSINYSAGILNCNLVGYDTDGYKGLAIVTNNSTKNINSEIVSGIGSIAGTIASGVSSIAGRAISSTGRVASQNHQDKQQKVTIPADYQFILK